MAAAACSPAGPCRKAADCSCCSCCWRMDLIRLVPWWSCRAERSCQLLMLAGIWPEGSSGSMGELQVIGRRPCGKVATLIVSLHDSNAITQPASNQSLPGNDCSKQLLTAWQPPLLTRAGMVSRNCCLCCAPLQHACIVVAAAWRLAWRASSSSSGSPWISRFSCSRDCKVQQRSHYRGGGTVVVGCQALLLAHSTNDADLDDQTAC